MMGTLVIKGLTVLLKNMRKLHSWYLLQDNNNGGKNEFLIL